MCFIDGGQRRWHQKTSLQGPTSAGPLQAEAAAKAKAKEDLKAFLLSNEINKKARGPLGPQGSQ